eukprot:gene5323-4285_t
MLRQRYDHGHLCADGVCRVTLPGERTPAYADDNHLTAAASRFLAPHFCAFLDEHALLPLPTAP